MQKKKTKPKNFCIFQVGWKKAAFKTWTKHILF